MRKYLVSGFLHFEDLSYRPLAGVAVLQPGERMDQETLAAVQHQLLDEARVHGEQKNLARPTGFRIHSFQPFETMSPMERGYRRARGKDFIEGVLQAIKESPDIQLNDCGTVLPPVDSPLLIEVAPGVLLKAIRPEHAESRDDQLVFNLESGGKFIGRPAWTHP